MGYLYTQLSRISESLLLASGAHLSLSLAGIFFLGFPLSFSLSAYTLAVSGKFGVGLALALPLALLAAMISGIIFAFIYTRVSTDSFAVVTLAAVLAHDAVMKSWSAVTGGVLGIAGVARPVFAATLGQLTVLEVIMALAMLATEFAILKAPLGRSLRALKENSSALAALGRSPQHIGAIAIVIAALTSGLAGLLAAWRIQFVDPSLGGILLLVQVLSIAIIAARPLIRWVMAGTAMVILVPELLRFLNLRASTVGQFRLLAYALLLLVLLKNVGRLLPQRRAT